MNAIHTHAGFPILWGFSTENNDFYTVQTVSPNPTPKQQPSQKTLCKKTFSLIYELSSYGPKMSPQGQTFLLLLSMWGHLVLTMREYQDTHTHAVLYVFEVKHLPFPFSPYAREGGIVTFLFSPGHMSFRPISRPLITSPTPNTNQCGWPVLVERLKNENEQLYLA